MPILAAVVYLLFFAIVVLIVVAVVNVVASAFNVPGNILLLVRLLIGVVALLYLLNFFHIGIPLLGRCP